MGKKLQLSVGLAVCRIYSRRTVVYPTGKSSAQKPRGSFAQFPPPAALVLLINLTSYLEDSHSSHSPDVQEIPLQLLNLAALGYKVMRWF